MKTTKLNRGAQIFLGIDPSLTETGVVWLDTNLLPLGHHYLFRLVKPSKKKVGGFARVMWIRDQVLRIIKSVNPTFVAIEDYAVGAKWGACDAGELGGVLRAMLHDLGVTFIEVPPNNLKKFASGKGGGGKIGVVLGVLKKWKVKIANHNVCDAYVLSRMAEGLDKIHRREKLLAYEQEAMAKVSIHVPGSAR